MNNNNTERKYDSYKIPNRQQGQQAGSVHLHPQVNTSDHVSFSDGKFYEMEYESNPITGASKYVMKPKPQKIE
jgi:hypothetical protein